MTATTVQSVHVLPNQDAIEHQVSDECICGPDVEFVGGDTVLHLHHSLDGREHGEPSDWHTEDAS